MEAVPVRQFDDALSFSLQCLSCSDLTLKPKQREILFNLFAKRNVFAWLPTGYGKSICYQVLPFLLSSSSSAAGPRAGLVIVVSPLVSLMVEQTRALRKVGVKAAILSTAAGKVDKTLTATEEDLTTCRLLFCAPEAVLCSTWRDTVQSKDLAERVVAVAIDEAHCVSKWSHEFRPCYGRIHEIKAFLPKGTPFFACTATATQSVREEVIRSLEMVDCVFICVSPDRPNIYYAVFRSSCISNDVGWALESLKRDRQNAERMIVYCRTLDMCAHLYSYFLYELGANAYYPSGAEELCCNRVIAMYHACTPQSNKDVVLKSLQEPGGIVRVVFATIALGMGIDLRNVNMIIHYGAPRSLEDYFQESGRGGRSGEPAKSIIYWKPKNCPIRKELKTIQDKETLAVRSYLENCSECRRYQLLKYFDPNLAKVGTNSNSCCDFCSQS